jgi:hypothetical protein
MSQPWRQKRYYRPRILLPYDKLASSELDDGLFFLSGSQLWVLRSLLGYAHRRISWVSEYRSSDYLTPTPEEWDDVEAFVAELEDSLMTNCCDDIVTALGALDTTLQANGTLLNTIATALQAQGVTLSDLEGSVSDVAGDTPGIVAALECICAKETQTLINITVPADWPDYPGATDAFDWGTNNPIETADPQANQEACELATAWYQAGFEWMTEAVLPALRFGFDKLIPAAAAAIAVWTGGVGLPAAIGVYAAAELIQELLELGYDAAEANIENWLYAHKQDIICPLYVGLVSGGTSVDLWDPIQADLVEPAPDLSAGDKFMIGVVMRYWGLGSALAAQAQASAWYTSIQTPGYCDACTGTYSVEFVVPPCPGNWYFGGGTVCGGAGIAQNNGDSCNAEPAWIPAPPSGIYDRVDIEVRFQSRYDAGEAARCGVYNWTDNIFMTDWQIVTCNAPVGTENVWTHTHPISFAGDKEARWVSIGKPGDNSSNPWPMEHYYVKLTFWQS